MKIIDFDIEFKDKKGTLKADFDFAKEVYSGSTHNVLRYIAESPIFALPYNVSITNFTLKYEGKKAHVSAELALGEVYEEEKASRRNFVKAALREYFAAHPEVDPSVLGTKIVDSALEGY